MPDISPVPKCTLRSDLMFIYNIFDAYPQALSAFALQNNII